MNSKYKVLKFNSNKFNEVEDLVSIEEPLEISLKFKEKNKWVTKILSITMRTPGDDENLVRGFLFNEQIVQNIKDIDNIKSFGLKRFPVANSSGREKIRWRKVLVAKSSGGKKFW